MKNLFNNHVEEFMKIALLAVYNKHMNETREEIGICSIAAVLRENKHEVLLMGANEKQVNYSRIIDFKPDIVGMPVYNVSKDSVYQVGKHIRELLPDTLICVGGCLPTYHAEEMMKEASFIDLAIRGEGEFVFLEMVTQLENSNSIEGVKGLTYRRGNDIFSNERQQIIHDINELPFISRDLLKDNKLKYADISTSRGCTRNCSFCCSPSFWSSEGSKWRGRDIFKVVDEIENIISKYGVRYFSFSDNSFEDPGINCKKVQNIAEEIIRRNLNICYFINLRAEFQRKASPQLMELLKKSGLYSVYIGIEAANEHDLRIYNKFAGIEDNEKIVELFRKYDIHVDIGFINFNPYSTFEGLRKNMNFLERHGFATCFPHASRYRIYKGSGLYERIKSDGLLKKTRFDDEFSYEYINKEIEKLANFLENYIFSYSAESYKIYFYSHDYIILLMYLKRQFESGEKNEAYRIVVENERQVKEVLSDLNRRNSKSFSLLIDMAEKAWDEKIAFSIMEDIVPQKHIQKAAAILDSYRVELLSNISRLGPEYSRYFIT